LRATKVVSDRLGHANIAFTIETYQHVRPGMQADRCPHLPATRHTRSTGVEQHGGTPEEHPRHPVDATINDEGPGR
jgi:hypothetical protein